MREPLILLDQLQKVYGDTTAVNRISLSITPGEIFGFLGANGAGKTTTIRMLCGLTRPSGGHASIAGKDVWKERYAIRPKFGYVAQKFSLYPDLTVSENLRFFGGAYRVTPGKLKKRIHLLLEQMDLGRKRDATAGSLSGGMRQLLAIGCALIHEPVLLFLDEPTAGLDPVHRQRIWDLLYDLSLSGTTIFVTTHYMDEADRCTKVGFLQEGRLLAMDSPDQLKRTFKSKLLELQLTPIMPALAQLRNMPGILGVGLRSGRARIYAAAPEALLAQWQKAWPFADVQYLGHDWADADMEDVFKAYSQNYHEILGQQEPNPAAS